MKPRKSRGFVCFISICGVIVTGDAYIWGVANNKKLHMRIAVIIGISEFDNCQDLPACINDIVAIDDLLIATNEFDEIKSFKGNVRSDYIKTELSTIFSELQGKDIEELFFYFSGHGSFINDEFYYILSDYDENVKRQTSLQNSEIDSMIKSINPKMVTKIIDACQSGVSYIKSDTNIVKNYYEKTTGSFDKCYFMHSSMRSQSSYIHSHLSDFTKSFLESIHKTGRDSIRYKDIMDYISDEFEKSTNQTPFFITQADFTEKFMNVSSEIHKVLEKYIEKSDNIEAKPSKEDGKEGITYIDLIKSDAQMYSSHEETVKLLNDIKEDVQNEVLQTDIKEIYNLKPIFEYSIRDLPKGSLIARWLESNPNNYFATAEYEKESYQEEVENKASSFMSFSQLMSVNKMVTKYRNVLVGFELTIDLPYKYIVVDFKPQFPNLHQYALLITFLVSKKEIKVFSAFTSYTETDWTKKVINKDFQWSSNDFLIKNSEAVRQFIKTRIRGVEEEITVIVENEFGI